MCSLHLTHPSAYIWSSGLPTLRCPGSSRGFGALLKGLTSVVDNSCRSRDSNPQPRVTSPTLYPLGHGCLIIFSLVFCLKTIFLLVVVISYVHLGFMLHLMLFNLRYQRVMCYPDGVLDLCAPSLF